MSKIIHWILLQVAKHKLPSILAFIGGISMTILAYFSKLPLPVAITIIMAFIAICIFVSEKIFYLYCKLFTPIDILYYEGKYNSTEYSKTNDGYITSLTWYRLAIINKSSKSLNSVSVVVETPSTNQFWTCKLAETGEDKYDIHPKQKQIINIMCRTDKAVTEPSTSLIITVQGQNIKAVCKKFKFNNVKEPYLQEIEDL